MYLVKKSFANNKISATKGRTIDIKDKSLASTLLNAGYIENYSEKELKSKELKKEIETLNKEIEQKDSEIETLKLKISELENVEAKNENNDDNLEENKDNK